jgi:hypothetical protein
LAVEKVLGALRLGTEKGDLQKRTIPTATATRADELDPIFQLCDRAFQPGPIDFLKEPSGWFVKGGLLGKQEMMKKTHHYISEGFSRVTSFVNRDICIQPCFPIFFEKVEAVLLGK